jgi:hypothetical protein
VIRGGSWNNDAENCRSAYRNWNEPGNRNNNLGFRLASTSHPPDGGCSRMASQCIRFVQPCRACAGVVRPNRPQPPASGSESEGRRGLFNTKRNTAEFRIKVSKGALFNGGLEADYRQTKILMSAKTANGSRSPPSIFISYSHADEEWKDRVVKQFRVLESEGHFDVWDDRQIAVGDDWYPEIEKALNEASTTTINSS